MLSCFIYTYSASRLSTVSALTVQHHTDASVSFIVLQTYEGGLGGEPGNEAHGGYTFCGVAALMLVDQAHQLDLPRLIHWAVHMQVFMLCSLPMTVVCCLT